MLYKILNEKIIGTSKDFFSIPHTINHVLKANGKIPHFTTLETTCKLHKQHQTTSERRKNSQDSLFGPAT
jgi:hypothetical protein